MDNSFSELTLLLRQHAWALVAIFTINRRDGAWEKPAAVPFSRDLMTVVASAILFAIVVYFHEAVIGVSPLPAM